MLAILVQGPLIQIPSVPTTLIPAPLVKRSLAQISFISISLVSMNSSYKQPKKYLAQQAKIVSDILNTLAIKDVDV